MIKWQYLAITATCALFACQGAGESKNKNQSVPTVVDDQHKTIDTVNKMELALQPDTFDQKESNKMSSYILTNNLDQEVIIPSSFTIEQWLDNKWQMVHLAGMLVFEDITYVIPPKSSKEFPLALSRILKNHAVVKGQYRLVKDAWIYKEEDKKSRLTAEFTIR